jgi:hypothetical protein
VGTESRSVSTIANQFTSVFKSRASIALLLFLCIDLLFRAALINGSFDRFAAAKHRRTWWQVKGYKELPKAPDVVLIGSSLLEHVVNEGEATYLKAPINAITHNKSKHFEDAVRSRTGLPISTFAFAVGGLHVSDAAVLVHSLFKEKTPSTLICAISPRDFVDNMLVSISSTEQFELMSRNCDLGELERHSQTSSEERFKHRSADLFNQVLSQGKFKYELATIAQRNYRSCVIPFLDSYVEKPVVPLLLPPDLRVTEFDIPDHLAVAPDDANNVRVTNNLQWYKFCYQPFRAKMYDAQFYYLDYLLRFAKQRGVNVILVNMPLRKDNLTAMEPNFYNVYKADLAKCASNYNVQLVDLFDADTFADSDFIDTVHLSGSGAVKFVDKLASLIAPDVASSVISHRAVNKIGLAGQDFAH